MSEENGNAPDGASQPNPLDLLAGLDDGPSAAGPTPEITDGPGVPEEQEASEGETPAEGVTEEPEVPEDSAKAQAAKIEAEIKNSSSYEVKNGEDVVRLRSDAIVPVKIDGEMVDVSVGDLRNNYSGKVAYDRKFQEVGHKNKELTTKLDQFEAIGENLETNPAAVIDKLAALTGKDRTQVLDTFLAQAKAMADELDELGEDGRLDMINNHRAKMTEERLKNKEESLASKENQTKIEAYVRQGIAKAGISEQEIGEAWAQVESGQLKLDLPKDQKAAIDKLIRYVQVDKTYAKIEGVLERVAPKEAENEKLIDTIYKVAGDLNEGAIESIIKEYIGSTDKDSSTELVSDENSEQASEPERAPLEENDEVGYGNELMDMIMKS